MLIRISSLAIGLLTFAACIDGSPALAGRAPQGTNCGRAIAAVKAHVTHADTRRLSRCVVAVLSQAPGSVVDATCARLRLAGEGSELLDHRARSQIEGRCRRSLPDWLPSTCPGPGPATGRPVVDGATAADCAVSSAHCLAIDALASLSPHALDALIAQHPDNVDRRLERSGGFSYGDCMAAGSTTTVPAPTTTTLLAITTTLPVSTTTLPAATTTLPAATTTLPVSTTTLPVSTTTLPASTTTLPASTTTTLPAPTTTLPASGEPVLVVSEVMSNPVAQGDTTGEYFEVFNAGNEAVDLLGLVVRDEGADAFVIDSSLVIAPGMYVVLGKSAGAAGGLVDYTYGSGMTLSNSEDEIVLEQEGIVIDRLAYGSGFPLEAGRALELRGGSHTASANDLPESWCAAAGELGDGDFGSPRAAGSCAP